MHGNSEEVSTRQVKVDNWGPFFLQRLQHFFNKNDFCDLTLLFSGDTKVQVHIQIYAFPHDKTNCVFVGAQLGSQCVHRLLPNAGKEKWTQ